MVDALKRYLEQKLERVEQTFLSAHVHQAETSETCVRIRHDSPPSPPLEEGRRYLLDHLCLHSGRRTSPPGPLSCEERGSRTKRCVNTRRAAWREGVNTASREYLLSIMIPVYNEADTIGAVIDRVKAVPVQEGVRKEIIVVDDGSTDGTAAILRNLDDAGIRVVRHRQNRGKGAAVRTALDHATGDWALIQDADLEYAPEDVPELIAPLLRDPSIGAVFGSRFLGRIEGMKLPNLIANKLLTWFTNLLFRSRITDLCTGYKLYRTDTLRQIPLVRDGFDLEHELTAKLLKKGCRIVDVPITYTGRDVSAGKKVRWTDFFINIKTLLKYRFSRI